MGEEVFLPGYCRAIDRSRIVTVEITDGEAEADCNYAACPYAPTCPIAQKIREL